MTTPDTVVLAIGANRYVRGDSDRAAGRLTRSHLEADLLRLAGSTDEQPRGAYAATAVSDRILIAGFMRALGLDRVAVAEVDLTDGLLVDEARWADARHGSDARR